LSDYLQILRRRWPWVTLATVVVMALATVVTVSRTDSYAATAQVILGNSAAQEAINDPLFNNARTADRELSNEVNLAQGDAVRGDVERQLGVEPTITVSADDESDSLRFTATAADPDDAALHANTWAEVYVEFKRREATDSIAEAITVFEADLADLRSERRALRQPLDELEDQLAAAADPTRQAELRSQLDRRSAEMSTEFDLLDTRVQAVAQNITQLELNRRLASTGTARVVQVAAAPQAPTNGSLVRNLVLATFVGLMAGVAAAIVAESLDRTIKTAEDVASLGLPVLGVIPAPGRAIPESELPLATMRHVGTPVAEGYQKVRTALEFALLGRQINSLLITSANQSEGKTTLSINLAWAMSAVDHRVALVDVDFRRPRIHDVFNCPAKPGLSDNLLSNTPLTQLALRVDEHGSRNLIVIPTGTEPPSPADFVASPTFTSLIRKIEAQADLVILDAPPVLPVSDAPSIGRQVDAVIVAVKAGATKRDELVETLEDLRGVGADVIGLCLVGMKSSSLYESYGPDTEPPGRGRLLRRARNVGSRAKDETVDLRDRANHQPVSTGRSSVGYGMAPDAAATTDTTETSGADIVDDGATTTA
ncbi:MAG: polysaccharide biosynthesis tyrosine autokinase, partial [Actinomycetota bacterium]